MVKKIPLLFMALPAITGNNTALHAAKKAGTATPQRERMNILVIVSDDLNDWIGCLGGNPQTITPNIDHLAASGGLVMGNAQCPTSLSNPSRTAMLTGLRVSTTGVYNNDQDLRESPAAMAVPMMPQYFHDNGYYTLSRGKIFHRHARPEGQECGAWAFDEWSEGKGNFRTGVEGMVNGLPERKGGSAFDWGPTKTSVEHTPDRTCAQWAADKITAGFDKPFFMMIGFTRPHLPLYVPQQYFDKFPLDRIKVPEYRMDDLDDILDRQGKKMFKPSGDFLLFQERGVMPDATRAYLACVNYVDDCVGVILAALDASAYKENTIVIFAGDNGFHMGEKLRYRKATLWEEAARVPLIIKVPGMTAPALCMRPVNLLDLYPTLAELCGLPVPAHAEGRSIVPLLENPAREWHYPALTTMGYKNHTLRDDRYRYNVYEHGAEELYDHNADPMEWNNLIRNPKYKAVADRFRMLVPTQNAPPAKQWRSGGGDE